MATADPTLTQQKELLQKLVLLSNTWDSILESLSPMLVGSDDNTGPICVLVFDALGFENLPNIAKYIANGRALANAVLAVLNDSVLYQQYLDCKTQMERSEFFFKLAKSSSSNGNNNSSKDTQK